MSLTGLVMVSVLWKRCHANENYYPLAQVGGWLLADSLLRVTSKSRTVFMTRIFGHTGSVLEQLIWKLIFLFGSYVCQQKLFILEIYV